MYKYLVVLFQFMNKHFYIIPLLSLLSKLSNNKYFKSFNWFIKIIIILNIIIGVGIILYFTDLVSPITSTYSFYSDFFQFYIDLIKQFWNDLVNIHNSVEDSIIRESINSQIKNNPHIINKIQEQIQEGVKNGVKDGIKEAIDQVLSDIKEDEVNAKANQLKTLAIIGSSLFIIYFLIALPNSTESLSHYNWINQSLIEFKLGIKDLIVNLLSGPGNPGAGSAGSTGAGVVSPINPTISNFVDAAVSPISDTLSTVTPNTPIGNSNILPSLPVNLKSVADASTQSIVDGVTVSRLVYMQNTVANCLPQDAQQIIQDGCIKHVKIITD